VEQGVGTGFERKRWTTGADHGRMTLANDLEVRRIGPPMKNPGWANNRGSPLHASGNSSYQILRFPNAPAAMIFKSKTAYGDDADALSYRLMFRFLRFQMRADI
jgi:hypothetical protein